MVREASPSPAYRQAPPSRGGPGFRTNRGGFQGRGAPMGTPAYVVAVCTYEHPAENQIVLKATDLTRVPKFNRGVYLESKARIGSVDEILGPINDFYYSAKLEEGVKASSLKKGQALYMSPEDMLPIERFLTKAKPARGTGPQRGGFRGGQRGAPRGNFRGGPSRGGPRGASSGFRGAPRGGGGFRGGRGGRPN
jgi:H/ACA ribonucleoprotein complex subunit 1